MSKERIPYTFLFGCLCLLFFYEFYFCLLWLYYFLRVAQKMRERIRKKDCELCESYRVLKLKRRKKLFLINYILFHYPAVLNVCVLSAKRDFLLLSLIDLHSLFFTRFVDRQFLRCIIHKYILYLVANVWNLIFSFYSYGSCSTPSL